MSDGSSGASRIGLIGAVIILALLALAWAVFGPKEPAAAPQDPAAIEEPAG